MICVDYQKMRGEAEHATHLLVIVADPERDRSSPITIPRDVPVSGVCEPIAESIVANSLGHPDNECP